MEHDIPFGNSNRETGSIFLDFPLFLGIFQWDAPTKRVPFNAEQEIPEILTKWKSPVSLWPRTIKILISNWPRTLKFSQFFKNTGGKTISYHGHTLVTLCVQFLCSDWSKFDRWVHAENLCSIFDSLRWSLQSFLSTCDVFNCLFPLDVQNEIQLPSRVFCSNSFCNTVIPLWSCK